MQIGAVYFLNYIIMASECLINNTLIYGIDFDGCQCVLRVQCLLEDNGHSHYEFLLWETIFLHKNGGVLIKDKMSQLFIPSNEYPFHAASIDAAKTERCGCIERLLNAAIV